MCRRGDCRGRDSTSTHCQNRHQAHVANIFAGGPASNTTWARNTPTSLSGSNYNIQTPAGSTFTFGPGLNPIAVIPPGGGLMIQDNIAGGFMWILCFFSESPI